MRRRRTASVEALEGGTKKQPSATQESASERTQQIADAMTIEHRHGEPPRLRIAAMRVVDMSSSNAWAEFSGIFARTRAAHAKHERAKSELKTLVPDDAKEAIGHGLRARRTKAGAISFDLLEAPDAAQQ